MFKQIIRADILLIVRIFLATAGLEKILNDW